MVEGGRSAPTGLSSPDSDAVAHAIVGAGESLANWWLGHSEVSREDVTDLYVAVVQATMKAAIRRNSARL
jgi:hypothetical protein